MTYMFIFNMETMKSVVPSQQSSQIESFMQQQEPFPEDLIDNQDYSEELEQVYEQKIPGYKSGSEQSLQQTE